MVGVDGLGGGVGLAGHGGGVGVVGLVHAVGNGGGVAKLDGLVVGLVGASQAKQGGEQQNLKKKGGLVGVRCFVASHIEF